MTSRHDSTFCMEDTVRYVCSFIITLAVIFTIGEASAALDVFVYPTKGQTKDQQEQDEFACYKWGKEKTGFDPTQTVQQAAPPQQHGQVVGGAARGAAGATFLSAATGASCGFSAGACCAVSSN